MDIWMLLEHDHPAPRLPKRQKTVHAGVKYGLSRERCTIAWICALPIEIAAALAMLDETHDDLPRCGNDNNAYRLGNIKKHNIVIACLPHEQYGNVNAANVLTNLTRSFPSVSRGLMVGIGGGAPSQVDVRLGDIVVGTRIMQYEFGKILAGGKIQRTAIPRITETSLRTAVSSLRASHLLRPSRIPLILQEKMKGHLEYCRPITPDRLFQASYEHNPAAASCDDCDVSHLMQRKTRGSQDPVIHYGAIASGDKVMKDAVTRDAVARDINIICFEMEAAGLMDILPCLSIRGICDYSDSHKAKEWQGYAAATAAAYAREFLESLAADNEPEELSDVASHLEQGLSNDRRKELLETLNFQQIDARKTNIKTAHTKTCRWFLKHPDYLCWLDPEKLPQHHGFLWIRGKPGAGKSIIMKFIYLNMKKRDVHGQTLTSSFFFNARGESLEKSVLGMYRSLLLQLLEGFPDLQRFLDDPDLVPRNQKECPPLNALKDIFRAAVSSLGKRSFTSFIDALDECDEQQVMDMVEFFDELAEYCTENGVRFQICFSSRHYPYIDIRSGVRVILENQHGHSQDMETYIGSRLRIKDTAIVEELKLMMLEKSAGVFLWIVLVVDILNKENHRGRLSLRKRLGEVPSDLSELFKDLLKRDQENMEELLLSILWILFAGRPLNPAEYYHALWSGLSLESQADPEIPSVAASDAQDCFDRCVISSSKGLAEITKAKKPTVQFIHESVRDFLLKDKGLNDLWPELGVDFESVGHEKLKLCCLTYIHNRAVEESILKRFFSFEDTGKNLPQKYPFLEYASQFILSHADAAADVFSQEQFLDRFSVPYWSRIFNIFEKHEIRRYDQDVGILYILAERGLPALIRIQMKRNPNIEIQGGRYRYPLLAALAKGNKASVTALLGLSSSIWEGVDITDGLNSSMDSVRKHHSPFSWACENGHLGIAKLLLQRGTCVYDADKQKLKSLPVASKKGHFEMVKWLIMEGVYVDSRGIGSRTPLSWAAEHGHQTIVQLLLQNGAAVDSIGDDGRTPLSWAAGCGHQTVVQLLLKKGAAVDSKANDGRTPLLWAAENGHQTVVQLLLEKEAAVNLTDTTIVQLLLEKEAAVNLKDAVYDRTPLSWAAGRGHQTIVQLLLKKEAAVNLKDTIYSRTPLSNAARNGYQTIVQLLLEKGAAVDSLDIDYRTPLSWAAERGHQTVVQLLLEKEAAVDLKDPGYGRTPLLWAAKNGHQTIVQLLLEKEAAVDSIDNDGRTPLLWAAGYGHQTIVQLLLEKGAAVDLKDTNDRTPLSWAAERGNKGVVQLLLGKWATR